MTTTAPGATTAPATTTAPVATTGSATPELVVDFIHTLDGFAGAEGWPGWWGMEGPEYLSWLDQQPEAAYSMLMGATTYRMFSDFADGYAATDADEPGEEEQSINWLAAAPKIVISSTIEQPSMPNTRLVRGDAAEAVAAMKRADGPSMRTVGSLSLCRALLAAGLVDRLRVTIFPVVTGRTGTDPVYAGWPDVPLDLRETRTFDGRLQMFDYVPTVLPHPDR